MCLSCTEHHPTPRLASDTLRHVAKQLQKRTQRQARLTAWAESLACRQRAIDEEVAYMAMYDEDGGQDSD